MCQSLPSSFAKRVMHRIPLFLALCLFTDLIEDATARTGRPRHGWKPEDLIPESYNKLRAPSNGTNVCDIKITLNITQILGVNEADEVSSLYFENQLVIVSFLFRVIKSDAF